MIFIKEKKDVRDEIEKCDFNEWNDLIYWAVVALEDYANESIYQDGSEGCCYEDNSSFVETAKKDLIDALEAHKRKIDEYIAQIKEVKPNL